MRVLLNLFSNALNAVNARLNESFGQQQKNNNPISYKPIVTVKTSLSPVTSGGAEEAHVLITVNDNRNGIPQKIFDKIFQPFFY